ncbi:prepilin-type N-terminal cleavage/methylation domain-containing protein [Thioalkalivibrio sp. ALJ2]|uniref:prepilin-type N-terminal cleavage/methylation domain-containing protein n=1 Tax=Thioalkalivibrio sp. ALJ2 TaxID=1261622 RepID=UPI000367A347|nr:prepilin-type N-terminal cleavage/methylation domain-containing protein [Thioalkalivibrio sp. ALJ2]
MKNSYRIALDQSKHAFHHRNQGFALLEAMIALVVFAVGLLAVAQFHGTLLKTSAESKASSEALYIAQQKVDELRSVGWEELQSGSETGIEGTNDIFDIEWGVAKDGGDLAQVFVRVNGSEIEGIQLYTAISRVADIALSQSDGDGVTGSYPVDSEGDPELPTDAELGRTVDGFEVRRENGEVSEIIDPDSGDFLQLPNGGARISGNIFFLDTDFEGSLPPIQVTATGNSLCRVFPGQGRTNSTSFGDYEALGYSCHVSNGWLGNIVAFSMEPSAQVCMGSPNNRPQAVSGGGGGRR